MPTTSPAVRSVRVNASERAPLEAAAESWGNRMRTTVNIDGELLAKASKLAALMDRTAILREALRALIERCHPLRDPAGAMPVGDNSSAAGMRHARFGAGAPGSRPQVPKGDLGARAGCQKHVRRRKPR